MCPTLFNPIDHNPPGSSIHGILQARILSRLPSRLPRDLNPEIQPTSPAMACGFAYNVGRSGFHPWVGKIPWKRERLLNLVSWPGEFHVLYNPWGCKESDMTERLSLSHFHFLYQQHHLGSPIFSLETRNIQSKSSELSILMTMMCSTSQLCLTL